MVSTTDSTCPVYYLSPKYIEICKYVVSPAGNVTEFVVGVGVHQGSTLRPLLINIVMNKITENQVRVIWYIRMT